MAAVPERPKLDGLRGPSDPSSMSSAEFSDEVKSESPFDNRVPEVQPTTVQDDAANGFVRFWRKVYRPLGFQKGYNFPLFVIFAGAMLGFALARFEYFSISGIFASDASPGEWFWYHAGHRRIGITLHLVSVIPAGFLMVWQFVPVIRHKFILFHRINGYVITILVVIGNVGALMIARRSFGGTVPTQAAVGLLAILTTGGLAMAIYNVKRLQIDQHRAWMLRTMFWLGCIITIRIIMIASASIISMYHNYYFTDKCAEILFGYGGSEPVLRLRYPQCFDTEFLPDAVVPVLADMKGNGPENIGAAFKLSFGMACWMSIFLHTIGVQLYLSLTPAESERLRRVSVEKQLKAGLPPNAGYTVQKFGDAEPWTWMPEPRPGNV